MLIVDSNKRYSIAQIKQHKWLIQGEPYEDLTDLSDPREENTGVCVYNEKVLQQMEKLGEDRAKIIQVCCKFLTLQKYLFFIKLLNSALCALIKMLERLNPEFCK